MASPVLFLGLDALDPALARRWASEGELATLARLFAGGARATVHNPFGLFVGALWVSFASAQRAARHGFHCWDEIDPASYRWQLNPPKPERYRAFWNRMGDAGRRIVCVDVPHARADAGVNGVELFEWGCHDRHYGLHSAPPHRAREIASRFGLHPSLGDHPWQVRDFAGDDFVERAGRYRTAEEEKALLSRLVSGAQIKGKLIEALVREEDWDLFIAVFGESHAVGHQQWHLHDESHPRFDGSVRSAVGGDPLLQLYRAIDAAVGRVIAAAPADALVIVHLSHGMGPHYDGTHLLDEVLLRLDKAGAGAPGNPVQRLRQAVKPLMPAAQHLASRLHVPVGLRRAAAQLARGERPGMRARRRFFASPNNSVYGGIRLNLSGREAQGRVRPDEVEQLAAGLETDLKELVNLDTGRPVVRAVHRTEAHHSRSCDDRMPDLLVEWERDALIETVASPKIGSVRTRYAHWRTGDHRPDGLLIVCGSGLAAGSELPPIEVEDIGPSIAAHFGLTLEEADGRAAEWSARAGSSPDLSTAAAPRSAESPRRASCG